MARRRRADPRGRGAGLRRPVRWTPVLGLSALLFIGGWTLLWFFARAEAVSAFQQWRDGERAFGRVWTCPGQSVGGFPLGIELTCEHPTFNGPVADGVYEGSFDRLSASTELYFPTRVVVTLSAPLQATEVATKRRYEASWSTAAVTLRGVLPDGLERGSFEAADVRLLDASRPQEAVQVGHLTLGFRPIARPTDAQSDLEATLDADGVRTPVLDANLGSSDPLRLHLTGFATQVRFDGRATAPEILGPWSRAGGQVHLQALDADKGALRIRASGRFGLDEDHRLEGRLETGFKGFEPIADRIGLPVGVLKVGSALASLLGGSNVAPQDDTMDVTLPVTAKNGSLMVGPVKTGVVLPPVY